MMPRDYPIKKIKVFDMQYHFLRANGYHISKELALMTIKATNLLVYYWYLLVNMQRYQQLLAGYRKEVQLTAITPPRAMEAMHLEEV